MTTWGLPDPSRTIHGVGDVHFESENGNNVPQSWFPGSRCEQVRQDTQRLATAGWVPKMFLQIGDAVENAGNLYEEASEDTEFLAWYTAMWPTIGASMRRNITGNHDVNHGGTVRTAAAAEAALGIASHRDVVDLGFAKLLLLCQDTENNTGQILQPSLDWLDAQLTAYASSECWIAYHHPFPNTLGGPTSGTDKQYTTGAGSTIDLVTGPNGVDATQVLAVLAAHQNAKAWICGHTHSALYVPQALDSTQRGITMPLTVGSHTLAHINLSAVAYVGFSTNLNHQVDPVQSAFITKPASGVDRIEVRYRDHGHHSLAAVNRQTVFTVNL